MSAPLMEIDDLHVEFMGRSRLFRRTPPPIRAVNGVSIMIERGKTFGLVGESGSGKSTLARAILQLVRPTRGTIRLNGEDATFVPPKRLLEFRRKVQAVLQNPYSALNQVHDVSVIVGDAITRHRGIEKGPRRDELVIELLEHVGLSRDFLHRQPYAMSGGQCQRVSIARALAVQPELVVADEVTSALDVSVQSQVVNLLRRIQREDHVAMLFIGHNLEVVRYMSDRIGVMYLGYLIESGEAEALYQGPTHPYTEMLIASNPVPDPVAQAGRRSIRRTYHRDAGASEPCEPSTRLSVRQSVSGGDGYLHAGDAAADAGAPRWLHSLLPPHPRPETEWCECCAVYPLPCSRVSQDAAEAEITAH